MRSKGQGLMATLLMFVPLLAVPVVATFGVPWLAAKAKSEGLPLPEFSNADITDAGVGQSRTARHSAEDLFAPVLDPPAVDLRMPSKEIPNHPPAPTVQNPHLRNASLVVPQEESWNDPFASLPKRKPTFPSQDPKTESFTPPKGLGDWTIKDTPPQTPSPSATSEAPLPQEFPEPENEETAVAGGNPFAEIDSELAKAKSFEPNVTVGSNAFEDPVPMPRVNRDPNRFDASRELFIKKNEPSSAPMQTAEVTPPAEVEPNTPSTLRGKAPERPPLTWDTARAHLKKFGITQFYLQPDAMGEVFHFRCAYSGGNSRINRVFEAQASDPLEAVGKVLTQLESYTARSN